MPIIWRLISEDAATGTGVSSARSSFTALAEALLAAVVLLTAAALAAVAGLLLVVPGLVTMPGLAAPLGFTVPFLAEVAPGFAPDTPLLVPDGFGEDGPAVAIKTIPCAAPPLAIIVRNNRAKPHGINALLIIFALLPTLVQDVRRISLAFT
jgi:hypothetical protein